MDCSLPGSSVHGILQARILEWVAIPSPVLSLYLSKSIQTPYAWENNATGKIMPGKIVPLPFPKSSHWRKSNRQLDPHQCFRLLIEYWDPLALAIFNLSIIPLLCLIQNSSTVPEYPINLLCYSCLFFFVKRTR